MNEDIKPLIDVRKLFPEVVRRMQILDSLRKSWPSVVGPAARHSVPYDLIKSELYVAVENTHTAQLISNMKGNITRALASHYDYHDEIMLKITAGRPPAHVSDVKKTGHTVRSSRKNISVQVKDSLVQEYIKECPDSLPEDAKFAISHLRAYLEARSSSVM